jgi:acetyl-CoA carboxylase biotin carboxylase subunit
VEHPVTELVTGYDLVRLQLQIAGGEKLPFQQDDIRWRGSAMECRICAEDTENNFFPSPGKIVQLREPSGPGVRLDSGVYPGWNVPIDYDPLLAKLVVWDEDRDSTIRRMLRALNEYSITGVETNLVLFREIMDDPVFQKGWLHTGFVADFFARRKRKPEAAPELELAAALAAAAAHSKNGGAESRNQRAESGSQKAEGSRWLTGGRGSLLR